MNLSRHDSVLLAVTVGVVLFGLVGMTARKQITALNETRVELERTRSHIQVQRALIEARDVWRERYDAVKDKMPVFANGDQVENYWFAVMDAAAERNDLHILSRSSSPETVVAGVCELPIEVRQWEATLEQLMRFIHDLESQGAMCQIRDLRVQPKSEKQGYLKGAFTLYCAYLRSNVATVDANALASAKDKTEPEAAPPADEAATEATPAAAAPAPEPTATPAPAAE